MSRMSKYIDADALIMHLSDYALTESPNDNDSSFDKLIHKTTYNAINGCIKAVEEMPAADVEPVKHGEWKPKIGYDPRKAVQCSNCRLMNYEPTEYCPHCGAKMQFMGGNE